MIKINNDPIFLDKVANDYASIIKKYIQKKGKAFCQVSNAKIEKNIGRILHKKLWEIIENAYKNKIRYCAVNSEIEDELISVYSAQKKYKNKDCFLSAIRKTYFDYDKNMKMPVMGKNKTLSYWIMDKLRIKTCPYCNRLYTTTIDLANNNKTRPELDHFYNKRDNEYLSSSFYNLVPSCPVCNHLKKNEGIGINPYFEEFGNSCKFMIDGINNCMLNGDHDWDLKLELQNIDPKKEARIQENIHILGLNDLYQHHRDVASEIAWKAISYQEPYFRDIEATFTKQMLKGHDFKTLVFGCPIDEEKLGDRPLSKLTRDLLEQIGVDL